MGAKGAAAMSETPSGKATMVFLRRGTAGAAEDPAVSTPFANEEAAQPWKRHPLYLGSRVIQQSLCMKSIFPGTLILGGDKDGK